MALAAYRARPESLERCSQLSWFPFRSVDTREHTDLAVPDEERCCDEAQDQRPQQHGVTELEEPHTQQTTHLDQVESGHLKKTHTHRQTQPVSLWWWWCKFLIRLAELNTGHWLEWPSSTLWLWSVRWIIDQHKECVAASVSEKL